MHVQCRKEPAAAPLGRGHPARCTLRRSAPRRRTQRGGAARRLASQRQQGRPRPGSAAGAQPRHPRGAQRGAGNYAWGGASSTIAAAAVTRRNARILRKFQRSPKGNCPLLRSGPAAETRWRTGGGALLTYSDEGVQPESRTLPRPSEVYCGARQCGGRCASNVKVGGRCPHFLRTDIEQQTETMGRTTLNPSQPP